MKHILKCTKCGSYTMKEICPKCSSKAVNPKPPKFGLEDKFGDYRRKAKRSMLEKEGLL